MFQIVINNLPVLTLDASYSEKKAFKLWMEMIVSGAFGKVETAEIKTMKKGKLVTIHTAEQPKRAF